MLKINRINLKEEVEIIDLKIASINSDRIKKFNQFIENQNNNILIDKVDSKFDLSYFIDEKYKEPTNLLSINDPNELSDILDIGKQRILLLKEKLRELELEQLIIYNKKALKNSLIKEDFKEREINKENIKINNHISINDIILKNEIISSNNIESFKKDDTINISEIIE